MKRAWIFARCCLPVISATALLLAAPVDAATPSPPAATDSAAVSKDAIAALERMSALLRSLQQFELRVDGHRELVTTDGQKLQFHTVSFYQAKMPNKLAVETRNLFTHEVALFDGQKLVLVRPDVGIYAEAPFKGTVDAMLQVAYDQYGIDFPVQDMFRWGQETSWLGEPRGAMVVGPDIVDGWMTTQYAVRMGTADFQIWIDQGDKPIPRRLVITDLTDPTRPQYTANFTWNLKVNLEDSLFSLPAAPAQDAVRPRQVPMEDATGQKQADAARLTGKGRTAR